MCGRSKLGLKQLMFCGKNSSAKQFEWKELKESRGHVELEDDTQSVWWSTAQNHLTVAKVCEMVATDH